MELQCTHSRFDHWSHFYSNIDNSMHGAHFFSTLFWPLKLKWAAIIRAAHIKCAFSNIYYYYHGAECIEHIKSTGGKMKNENIQRIIIIYRL